MLLRYGTDMSVWIACECSGIRVSRDRESARNVAVSWRRIRKEFGDGQIGVVMSE